MVKTGCFSPKIKNKTKVLGCSLWSLSFNIVVDVLVREIREGEEMQAFRSDNKK
jgi:hypothetical protein